MKKVLTFMYMFALIFGFTAVSLAGQGMVVMDSGLKYVDLEVGTGDTAEPEKIADIHFTGWLDDNGLKGAELINSYGRGKPVSFKLGTDKIMKGLNEGVRGMKVGGKRRLMIPSNLGYGAEGGKGVVPPNADLIFDVELLDVR